MLPERTFIKTNLGEVASEVVRWYKLPFGFKIRFESGGKAIRADKEVKWWPIGARTKARGDWTVKGFTDYIGKRIDGLECDNIEVMDHKNKKIPKMTLLTTVKEMEGLLSAEGEKAEEIFETTRRRIKSRTRFHPDDVSVLKILVDILVESYSIEAVEEAVSEARKEIDEE
ncbi:MAG: hypothetical protein ACLQVJ_25485 [Syntrophobacteraceae bacterium]